MKISEMRSKLAGWILGNQTALFLTKEQSALVKEDGYSVLNDEDLGKMYRRSWATILNHYLEQGKEENRPFTSVVSSASVLFLTSMAQKSNAETTDITVTGSLDGGKTEGTWAVHVYQVADKKVKLNNGVVTEYAEDDPERLTKLNVTFENPGYHQWILERRIEREKNGN